MNTIPLFVASMALAYQAHHCPPRSLQGEVFVAFAISLCAFGLFVLIPGGRK